MQEEVLKKLRARLDALPPKKSRSEQKLDVMKALGPKILSALKQGYTAAELAVIFTETGLPMTESAFKRYLRDIKASGDSSASRRRGRKTATGQAAGVTSPGVES